MKETTNFNLKLPEAHDYFDVEHQNTNMGIIDAALKEAGQAAADAVPKTRKVNGKALTADITLVATDVGAPTVFTASATMGTSWSGSGPYTQTVTVAGMTSTDRPHIGPVWSATAATRTAQREAWNLVSDITTQVGSMVITCDEGKPVTSVPLQIEVIRGGV